MKRFFLFILSLVTLLSINAKTVVVETRGISLVINAEEGKSPQYLYCGAKLKAGDVERLQNPRESRTGK